MTAEPRRGLGPLGNRLLLAFVLVSLTSVIVLVVTALVGTSRGLAAEEGQRRQAAVDQAAAAGALAYTAASGWEGADLAEADAVAADSGARLVVRDAGGAVVSGSGSGDGNGNGSGPGSGMGNGMSGTGSGAGALVAPVVVDGAEVGSVRLSFGTAAGRSATEVAWSSILVAALAALAVAVVMGWFVTRRIASPLVRLSDVARDFAAGDRTVRTSAADSSAPGELGELARAFDLTAENVERSETARRRMASDVAHELRTPLAALQAGLEELRDGLVEPDATRLGALHDQSLRLGRVVDDLAQLSDAETAALSLRREPVDLGELVAAAVQAARPSLESAGLTVSASFTAGVVVDADVDRLHQALGNLLANTARHCRAGDTVSVTVESRATEARVEVADTGPGIDPADLGHVFDRLWRGRADSEGSGIGLAVVREIVTAHGGTVEARSDGASGSSFLVVLPIATV